MPARSSVHAPNPPNGAYPRHPLPICTMREHQMPPPLLMRTVSCMARVRRSAEHRHRSVTCPQKGRGARALAGRKASLRWRHSGVPSAATSESADRHRLPRGDVWVERGGGVQWGIRIHRGVHLRGTKRLGCGWIGRRHGRCRLSVQIRGSGCCRGVRGGCRGVRGGCRGVRGRKALRRGSLLHVCLKYLRAEKIMERG